MTDRSFKFMLRMLYAIGLTVVVFAAVTGLSYYGTPVSERPHLPAHQALKPGGVWGHGYGVIGSAMILLLFLYSGRKKRLPGLRSGRLRRWLDVHIFFGVMGPLLITLHTAMKFHGIVSISYFSMAAVALSGVFGRYVYMQIPKDVRGDTISLEQLQRRDAEISETIRATLHAPEDVHERIMAVLKDNPSQPSLSKPAAIVTAIADDIALPFRMRRLRRYIRARGRNVPSDTLNEVVSLAREKALLKRRITLLNAMKSMFHYWHVIHKPFAYIMVIIMFVHIVVTVSFGYRWVF